MDDTIYIGDAVYAHFDGYATLRGKTRRAGPPLDPKEPIQESWEK